MNKQIEEMAKVMCDHCNDTKRCTYKICKDCLFIAEALYNAGYRNVHDFAKWHAEEQLKLSENVSKETAREILQELREHTQRVKNLPNKVFSWKEKFERLEELIAEIYPRNYGVEVE